MNYCKRISPISSRVKRVKKISDNHLNVDPIDSSVVNHPGLEYNCKKMKMFCRIPYFSLYYSQIYIETSRVFGYALSDQYKLTRGKRISLISD